MRTGKRGTVAARVGSRWEGGGGRVVPGRRSPQRLLWRWSPGDEPATALGRQQGQCREHRDIPEGSGVALGTRNLPTSSHTTSSGAEHIKVQRSAHTRAVEESGGPGGGSAVT